METRAGGGLQRVPVGSIVPNPRQPRRAFSDESLGELEDSIKVLGILQPLLVRESGAGFELIAGERRLRAARAAGIAEVPVLVVDTDERGSLERALVENVHREDLNAIEEAAAYRQLIDEGGLTQEELGRRVGRNRVTIANSLRLLDLPVEIQRYLIEGKITAGHGRALLALQSSPFQERMARRVAHEGLSVRETEEQVRKYQSMTQRSSRSGAPGARPPQVSEAQRKLSDHLQTRVRVEMGKRKGKIVVDFATLEELERLMSVLTEGSPGGTSEVVAPD